MEPQVGPAESSVATWDAIVDGWERHHEQLLAHTGRVDERMMELAEVRAGEVILELAAGVGALSRALAARVLPGGQVICSDASARMVEAARRHTSEALPVDFQVMDAQAIDLDDASVDLVMCKMGLMLMPDPTRAAAEARRVLRAGGRLVAATWGPLDHNLWIATFGAAMLAHGHAPVSDPTEPGGIFSLGTADELEDLLHASGFDDVAVETLEVPERVASFDDYWRLRAETSGPLTIALETLEAHQVDEVKASCEEFASACRHEDGSYRFPGQALITLARC